MFRPSSKERVLCYLIQCLLLTLGIWVAAELVKGIYLVGWQSTLVVAAILGLLNAFVKPTISMISLPLTILTLGLFSIVINSGLLLLTSWIAKHFNDINFYVDDFVAAVFGAVIISFVSIVVHFFINLDKLARGLSKGR
ncbi:MAG: putative membrane protein [Arenicella sp.]|jgi:putative membrane protein